MKNEEISRRRALQQTALLGLSAGLTPNLTQSERQTQPTNPIIEENKKPGSNDWQLTRVRPDKQGFRSPWIEGYCSKQSLQAGESIDIMVSTAPEVAFKIEIFRTGYYQGKGARLLQEYGPFQGKDQPTPEPGHKNVHECEWEPTMTLTIPDDWLSGVYLGRLTTLPQEASKAYWQSYVIFIVTDNRQADFLFQCSDNTWQAYNRWPNHYSVYTDPKGGQGPWANVSFDRPYGRQAQFNDIVNDPLSFGSGEFLSFEQPFAYFLEAHGYDVTYCSNSDLLSPDRALKCKAFLSIGHDEYWDIRQFRSVEKLKAEGVNLLFFSGNSVCWVSPLMPSRQGKPNRVFFRGGPYGGQVSHAVTREQDHGPFPERGPDEGYLMGVRNIRPVNGGGDWTVVNPDHWIFEGTGMVQGESIPGIVGWEYHGNPPDIPGLEILAEGYAWVSGEQAQFWSSVIYPGPKNNFIFNASTIFWAQGLSHPPGHTLPWSHYSRPHGPDERIQKITHNLLKRAQG